MKCGTEHHRYQLSLLMSLEKSFYMSLEKSFYMAAHFLFIRKPPLEEKILFSRCFKITCKMFYFSKRCFKFSKHLEHVQKVRYMF
jgi:hypothetical protein